MRVSLVIPILGEYGYTKYADSSTESGSEEGLHLRETPPTALGPRPVNREVHLAVPLMAAAVLWRRRRDRLLPRAPSCREPVLPGDWSYAYHCSADEDDDSKKCYVKSTKIAVAVTLLLRV